MASALGSRSVEGRTAMRVRLTRAGVAVAVAFSLLFVYYAWTATSSGNPFTKVTPFGFSSGDSDYYNLQADAFLHGRLWLDVPFDPRLKTAENPYALYNPNSMQGLPDGSFYNDKYYLAWGPAPALTTFLPPRLVGLRIQENLAITLYCFFGVLFAAMTLTLLVRRLVPGTSRAVLWTGNATLALATAIPWILRRPTIYEVAITAAFFFMMAGLLVLVRELLREEAPRRRCLALAGTLFGLAVLSRPTMVFVVAGVAGLAWVLRPEGRRTTAALVVGIPALAGFIFMIYNAARFSGPLDFGNRWQTSGKDVRHIPFNDISNLPPALYGYLLAPLHLTVGFPYIHLPPPPSAPFSLKKGFGAEPTGSVVWAVPFTLLALVFAARRRRPAAGQDPGDVAGVPGVRPVVLSLIAVATLVLATGVYGVPGYTERYELDFLPWLVMAATLGWAALIRHASTARRAAWWRRGGMALAAWGILVGVATSFTGYYDSFNYFEQGRYRALERAFSPLPTLAAKIAGRPMLAGIVAVPNGYNTTHESYTKLDIPGPGIPLQPEQTADLTIVSPDARDARLTFRAVTRAPGTFAVSQTGAGEGTPVLVQGGDAGTLPLHLKRGVNYVAISLTMGADVPPAADGSLPTVELRDVYVR
jgi:hypothetical protein